MWRSVKFTVYVNVLYTLTQMVTLWVSYLVYSKCALFTQRAETSNLSRDKSQPHAVPLLPYVKLRVLDLHLFSFPNKYLIP